MTTAEIHDPSSTCGCCEAHPTPAERSNRPGLPAIVYRAGTHATFLDRMIGRLITERVPGGGSLPPLAALHSRDPSDLSIALLDAFATVADVLSFYSERIANEGFLRTATERRSILELARATGYELRPGVAASTFLAFTVDPSQQELGPVTVPLATRVQSVPGPGETSQTFETMESLEARSDFNEMRPSMTEPWLPWRRDRHVFVRGVQTGLRPGDGILFVGKKREKNPTNENWDFRLVSSATPHSRPDGTGYTEVTWDKPLGWHRGRKRVDPPAHAGMKLYTFRLRASLFGHNAPDWKTIPPTVRAAYSGGRSSTNWPNLPLTSDDTIDLDAVYPQIVRGSWVVLARPGWEEVYQVTDIEEHSVTDFTLTSKTTQLTLSGELLRTKFRNYRRDVVVFAQSERLDFAERPFAQRQDGRRIIPDRVEGREILLDRLVDGLKEGQRIAVSGTDVDSGDTATEIASVFSVSTEHYRTKLALAEALERRYLRGTVIIRANVVRATHGETIQDEVLGSGDASAANQRFDPKRRPLTFLSSALPAGIESTLQVRVDEVLWPEAPSFLSLGSADRQYVVRVEDDGRTVVRFGDGRRGARLPSGIENVKSTYRFGSGPEGEVAEGRLTLMPMRPSGIREVTNPVAATGSAPPESLDGARINAPRHVLTLGRVVSLQDYEDFTRTYPAIGKAQARVLWSGENRFVHLTAATAMGTPLKRESDLHEHLHDALDANREPRESFLLDGHLSRTFSVTAEIAVDPLYRVDKVLDAVRGALLGAFSFEHREFAQGVTAAEVTATMQSVDGVRAVDLDRLARDDRPGAEPDVPPVLDAQAAHFNGVEFLPAELLLVNADGIRLSEMKP